MLQINTELYPDGVGRSQTIRGIFYSNICLRGCLNSIQQQVS